MIRLRSYAPPRRVACALAAALALSGCAGRLDHFGKPPSMSPVSAARHQIDPSLVDRPHDLAPAQRIADDARRLFTARQMREGQADAGAMQDIAGAYETADVAPAERAAFTSPAMTRMGQVQSASLWSAGPKALFGDRRAKTVGDILTVLVEIDDEAAISNSTTRTRSGSDNVTAPAFLGLPTVLQNTLPEGTTLTPAIDVTGSQSSSGDGSVAREEEIDLRVAATVVQVLPNGHLVVSGNQEVRVNFELRDLQVAGIIRPEDITRQNTITYDKMANARISYGGRGQISDLQQPRLGQQVVDMISPF